MSDGPDEEEKTEAPSARRLQQAFDDGQAPVGKDAVMVAGLAGGVVSLMILGGQLRDACTEWVAISVRQVSSGTFHVLFASGLRPFGLMFAVAAASATMAILATVAQTRGGFWPHLALPDGSRLMSLGAIGRILKREFWAELALSMAKLGAVLWAVYPILRASFLSLDTYFSVAPADALTQLYRPVAQGGVKVLATLAVLAGADFALTQWRFHKRLRMTKEEAKREYKQDEGDPMIRSRRRRAHRELSKNRIVQEVPRADAIIVNPTHIAIAVRYRRGEDGAPKVIAKGKGPLAELIRDLARENSIPIVQDIPLARLLYKKVKVGRSVPAETYKAVAAVLAFVYRMTGRNGQQSESAGRRP